MPRLRSASMGRVRAIVECVTRKNSVQTIVGSMIVESVVGADDVAATMGKWKVGVESVVVGRDVVSMGD